MSPGREPVYDVSYTIMKVLPPKPSIDTVKQYFRNQQSDFAPVVFGGKGTGLLSPTPIQLTPGEYGVHIWMRNGEIIQHMRMDFDGKQWIQGNVVKRDDKILQSSQPENLTTPTSH
jgi:hypothetical protein